MALFTITDGPDLPAEARTAARPVRDWLIDQVLLSTPVEAFARSLLDQVQRHGPPVLRLSVGGTTLHPDYRSSTTVVWRSGRGEREFHDYGALDRERFQTSPLNRLLEESRSLFDAHATERGSMTPAHADLRLRLHQGEGLNRHPVVRELVAAGATDYLALVSPIAFGGVIDPAITSGVILSWTTDRPGGFTDVDVATLRAIQPAVAAAWRTGTMEEIGHTVVRTYLGRDAGERVLQGDIRRGEAETLDAIILLLDLRGFTRLADTVSTEAIVRLLDAYWDRVVPRIMARGGQVLKFLGDGLLATFAIDEGDRAEVAAGALAAAAEIQQAIAALNVERGRGGEATTTADVALHAGEVLYGNVGGGGRLDFTVSGPAVNEASRIEALCQPLGHPVLASDAFVRCVADARRARLFEDLGEHVLRGVSAPRRLFAPRTRSSEPEIPAVAAVTN